MLVMTACGKSAAVDESAVSRAQDDHSDVHYIDENAIALAGSAETTNGAAAAQAALALVNEQRAAAGEAPLTWSQGLANAAMVRASECERSFSHTRPDGTDWWTVNSDLMYGENLAYNYYDAGSVVSAWMASPGHKANILNAGYATVGIAVYQTSNGAWYWAEEFGY